MDNSCIVDGIVLAFKQKLVRFLFSISNKNDNNYKKKNRNRNDNNNLLYYVYVLHVRNCAVKLLVNYEEPDSFNGFEIDMGTTYSKQHGRCLTLLTILSRHILRYKLFQEPSKSCCQIL